MCEHCGCSEGLEKAMDGHPHVHTHEDGTTHAHSHHNHDHSHAHHDHHETHNITLEQNILAKNDAFAANNRAFLRDRGVIAINIISSPGSGKTTLLERTLEAVKGIIPCAVIAGDQQTDRDAQRLMGKGAPVYALETFSSCHLDAEHVGAMLPDLIADDTKLLFIENVGNLVCPAAFDLGEHFKVALLSTAEGEDKPIKYPVLFSQSKAVVLTKMDLAPHLDWDVSACRQFIQQVNPGMFIIELSAKTGAGMDAWLDYLKKLVT